MRYIISLLCFFTMNICFAESTNNFTCKGYNNYHFDIGKLIKESVNHQPQGLNKLKLEGLLHSDEQYKISENRSNDFFFIFKTAKIWSLYHNVELLESSKLHFMSWINTYHPDLNPINEAKMDDLINSYPLIKGKLNNIERDKTIKLFNNWYNGYYREIIKHESSDKNIWINNWQSHRIELLASLAKSLNNKKYIEDAKKLFLIQIGKNIDKNGITIDYKQRNAVAYAVYDLEPLVHTALLLNPELYFKKIGNHGVSLSQGIAWLKPYLTGDKRNIEFENTKNKFDLERKKEGLKEFQGSFNPMLARKLIFLVSQIDENYKNLSLSLNGESGGVYNFFCEK